jgi:amidase
LLDSAVALEAALANGRLSASALTDASLARIRQLDGDLKAFITVADPSAREAARACDARPTRGALAGLPLAVKDLTATAGLRTTQGSRAFADHVPDTDDVSVARARAAGAIVIGKTNTPEFGFGAVCTNRLCGPTANPFDPALTSGGSSGGSAVAVATGMAALALGTDFGGSVRTPASFCGVVGFRPTPGRIPVPDRRLAWEMLSTVGIMTRTVEDAALLAGVVIGPDPMDPCSQLLPPFVPPALDRTPVGRYRVAASVDLGTALIARDVAACFERAVERIAGGHSVTRAHPDTDGARNAFETLRAAHVYFNLAPLLEGRRADLTESVIWNAERGRDISAERYLAAEADRARVFRVFLRFFDRFDLLVTPAAAVLPFPNAQGDVLTIDDRPLAHIIDYLTITYVISIVGFPAIVIPAGRAPDGRPFGLQLIARHGADAFLLEAAHAFQQAFGMRFEAPPMLAGAA